MLPESRRIPMHDEWAVERGEALLEADRIRDALEIRAQRRQENADNIEAKLSTDLSERHREKLSRELDFLKNYNRNHPIGEAAVGKHIYIKFGFSYTQLTDYVKEWEMLYSNSKDILSS